MREILFRGKRALSGGWAEGSLVKMRNYYRISEKNDMISFGVETETIGQFTGLTDKNGKRIFEGDIVLFNYVGENLGVNGKAAVDFSDGKFGVFWGWHKEFVPLDGFANTTIEVIGNIHDNPELMETT